MSAEKKTPPIQPFPVRPFTIRLVNGHFQRVPRVGTPAPTDATCPPTEAPACQTVPYGDGVAVGRNLRLVDGRFVSDADLPPSPAVTAATEDASDTPADPEDLTVEFPGS